MFVSASSANTIKYLWSHVSRYKLSLLIVVSFISVATFLGSIIYPLYFKDIIDLMSVAEAGNRQAVLTEIISLLIILVALMVFEAISWRIAAFTNNHLQPSVFRDMSNDIFLRLHKHSIGFFADHFIGSLVTKTKRLINGFERIADIIYWELLRTFIVVVSSIVILFNVDSVFGWILLSWSIVFMIAAVIFSLWKMRYDLRVASADSQVTGSFADSLTNYFNVKIFTHLPYEKDRFDEVTENQKYLRKFNWDLIEFNEIFQGIMMILLEAALLYVSIQFWAEGKISVGTVVLINSLSMQIMLKIWTFGKQVRFLITAFADCTEMTDLLYTPQEIIDPKNPEDCKIEQGEIKFQKVNFAYDDNNPVFNNLSLKIAAGEKIGLVGVSGSGKSTFTKLLFRFNDVNSGKILIDGQDITKIRQVDLRSKIAFVPQEPILFHRSLMENIRYGNLQASKEEVLEAAKNAHAYDFICKTKYGFKTLVGERGIKLSGGEKQRIAIARAMLTEAPILILDEATSALDSHAEVLIQEALEKLMKDRTTIVIAHRLSTLRRMDRIVVLDKGVILEEGSHEDLVAKGGIYAKLWEEQVGGFISG